MNLEFVDWGGPLWATLEIDSAGTEHEATSPETDTRPGTLQISASFVPDCLSFAKRKTPFSTVLFPTVALSYEHLRVSMLCINHFANEM